jgi:hypothetical protein
MRGLLLALATVATIGIIGAPESQALPLGGLNNAADAVSSGENVRLYCYNRYTGRFLHWGPCGGGGYYRRPGRVYCYNRYTGRFLHWGHC